MPRVAYYVTGHGLGHASRSVLVVKHLLESGHTVDVVTSVRASFFIDQINSKYALNLAVRDRILDGGAIQSGPLAVDGVRSLEKYYTIHQSRVALEQDEVAYLRDLNIDIVISDATPIACKAGWQAGCKVVILSNFTWDWIYREMLLELRSQLSEDETQRYAAMIDECAADYCLADIYLQLPGVAPLPTGFDVERLCSGPLLAGQARRSSEETRQSLGLTPQDRVLLLGFGGHKAEWQLQDYFLPEGWKCLVLGAEDKDMPVGGRFLSLSFECFVPDLVQAADAVLGKLGYGFVSECLSNGTPLVFVPRSCWPEESCLETFMKQWQACLRMPVDDFTTGQWTAYLEEALDLKFRMATSDSCAKDVAAVGKIVDTALLQLPSKQSATVASVRVDSK